MRSIVLALALLLAPTWLAGQSPDAPRQTVRIRTFGYRPSPVEIPVGTRVRWINEDAAPHTVTSGTPEAPEHHFDLSLTEQNGKADFTFTQPGTYRYHCTRHPFMRGEIHVTTKGEQP